MTPQEIFTQLATRLGPTAVAMACRAQQRDDVTQWRNGSSVPSGEQLERARVALELLDRVSEAETSDDTARAWFVGGSIQVGDGISDAICPLEAIRNGDFDSARASAQRLIDDVPAI